MLRIVRNAVGLAIVLAAVASASDALTFERVAPGIERATATTRSADAGPEMRLWIYRPAAKVDAGTWPCVFVAAGGSNGAIGKRLDAEELAEHLPYVKQGFVVVAYDVDGPIGRDATVDDYLAAARAFVAADGGLANLRAAIAYARANEPSIDASRIYLAGHGSAGTLALRGAAAVPNVRGVLAYAPLLHPLGNAHAIAAIDAGAPGSKALLTDRQPLSIAATIRCPVMLYQAADDDRTPMADVRQLASLMKDAGNAPLVVEVPTGGHIELLFAGGLEAGAAWLADRAKRDAPTTRPAH